MCSTAVAACDLGDMRAGWWFRPEFIINELNINSVITTPCHDETLTLSEMEYTVRGYAYTGTHFCNPELPCKAAICRLR